MTMLCIFSYGFAVMTYQLSWTIVGHFGPIYTVFSQTVFRPVVVKPLIVFNSAEIMPLKMLWSLVVAQDSL